MSATRWTGLAGVCLAAAAAVWSTGSDAGLAAGPARKTGADAGQWNRTVDKAIQYLKSKQAEDGSWSRTRSPGVSGIALTGLLSTGKVRPEDPVAERGLKYVESLVNPKAGHIAGKDARPQLLNYVTSVNVMALSAANRDARYKRVIGDAAEFLKKLQWDEEEGKKPEDDFYGGAGYDSKSRPDLSNTQMFLDALKEAGVAEDDPALKKALVFVTRCQNLKSDEGNDRPWAGKINDGSFIYSAAGGGQTKVEGGSAEKGFPGYGSMTYAGIKSMIYCGVRKDDPRVQKAFEWVQKHYTLEANPGMPKPFAHRGLYYYYHTLAKTLDLMGVDQIKGPDGKMHDWRAELTAELAKRQKDDGRWVNDKDQWMEGDPNLVTGYALMALSHCKPKK